MKTRKIKYKKNKLSVMSLTPSDFMSCSYWPFAYYYTDEDKKKAKFDQPERDWKLKPKKDLTIEEKLDESIKFAFKISLNITDELYDDIKKDTMVYNFIFNEIFASTYKLNNIEKFFSPQKYINLDFAEGIAVKSKAMSKEPYSFIADLSKEKPELYNPRRYDFNYFILGVLWNMEARENEKAQKEADKQAKKHKVRR